MKIAILSMQDVFNFGSLLQAYGLKKIVKEVMPDAEICYLSIKSNPKDNVIATKAVTHFDENERKFDRYFIHRLVNKFSNRRQNKIFTEFQNENFIKCSDNEKVDFCIIGSDEVFNCCNADTWGFTTQLFGNVKNANEIITYAASCGFATVDLLTPEMKKRIREAFTHISAFSVRDIGTQRFVSSLTEQPIEFHLDPVLITNFAEEIKKVEGQMKVPENLCIVYSYHNRISDEVEIRQIKEFARKRGMKLVTIGASQKWISSMLVLTPFEVLYVFSRAKFIITDTFHGTIFASKYNGKFATILRKSNNNKLSDLVIRLNIEDHVIHNFSHLEEVYLMPTTIERVSEIVEVETARAISYLKDNLT